MNLNERLEELLNLYKSTGDEQWLHRYNECQYIREKVLIIKFDNQITDKSKKYDPLEHQRAV
jgi:acyl carrier protein phosphodiesterase